MFSKNIKKMFFNIRIGHNFCWPNSENCKFLKNTDLQYGEKEEKKYLFITSSSITIVSCHQNPMTMTEPTDTMEVKNIDLEEVDLDISHII